MRLTDDRTAKALKEISDKLKAGGFEVDVSNERYIKLAEYEQTGLDPEQIRQTVRCKDCEFNYGLANGDGFSEIDIVCSYWMTDGLNESDFCSQGKLFEKTSKE